VSGGFLLRLAYEAVSHKVRVDVASSDLAHLIDALRSCALTAAVTRARSVEHGDGAVWRPHEAVGYANPINAEPGNRAPRVDAFPNRGGYCVEELDFIVPFARSKGCVPWPARHGPGKISKHNTANS